MMRPCDIPTLIGFCAYGVLGFRIRDRLKHEALTSPLAGFAAWRAKSYSPAGQVHLRAIKRWAWCLPLVGLLLAGMGGGICYLFGEKGVAP